MSNQVINIADFKQVIENLPRERYTAIQVLVSRFGTDPISVHYTMSVGGFSSTLAPSIAECLEQYRAHQNNTSGLESKLAGLEAQIEETKAEIARRKAAKSGAAA